MDKSRFLSAVSLAQAALVRVRDAGGKASAADKTALEQLASESRSIGAEIGTVSASEAVLPGETYLRDTPIFDANNPGLALTGRAWNIAQEWQRNIEGYEKDKAAVSKEATASDGLYYLAAILDEILARPTRKTAGQTPGLDPISLERLKAPTLENANAKLDLIIDAIQKIAKAQSIPL